MADEKKNNLAKVAGVIDYVLDFYSRLCHLFTPYFVGEESISNYRVVVYKYRNKKREPKLPFDPFECRFYAGKEIFSSALSVALALFTTPAYSEYIADTSRSA